MCRFLAEQSNNSVALRTSSTHTLGSTKQCISASRLTEVTLLACRSTTCITSDAPSQRQTKTVVLCHRLLKGDVLCYRVSETACAVSDRHAYSCLHHRESDHAVRSICSFIAWHDVMKGGASGHTMPLAPPFITSCHAMNEQN